MSTTTVVIIGCAFITALIKATGPVLSGGREIPPAAREVLALFAPALLAALVVVESLAEGKDLKVDATTAGVVASGLVYWRTKSIVWCVISAAAVTAGIRALT